METSDPSHRTEARVVVPADFNKEICVNCPAGEEGEVENRGDTVARECELEQAIAVSNLRGALQIREEIETTFGHAEELPECSAMKNYDRLGEGLRISRIVVNAARRMMDARPYTT